MPGGGQSDGGATAMVSKVSVHLKNYGHMPTNCSDQARGTYGCLLLWRYIDMYIVATMWHHRSRCSDRLTY